MLIKKAIILLGLLFWPLTLYLSNTPREFSLLVIPPALLSLSYVLYTRSNPLFYVPLLAISAVFPKLTLIAWFVSIALFFVKTNFTRSYQIFFVVAATLIVLVRWQSFQEQSIFKIDYEAQQEVLRDIHLYPNPLLARTFQNKARIIGDKFLANIFALTDPSNYFFSFHPREDMLGNQNLIKFPYLALVPFLLGIFDLDKLKQKKLLLVLLASQILALALVTPFDRDDFVLWPLFGVIFIHGINTFWQTKRQNLLVFFSLFFVLISTVELVRAFFIFKQ